MRPPYHREALARSMPSIPRNINNAHWDSENDLPLDTAICSNPIFLSYCLNYSCPSDIVPPAKPPSLSNTCHHSINIGSLSNDQVSCIIVNMHLMNIVYLELYKLRSYKVYYTVDQLSSITRTCLNWTTSPYTKC